MSEVAKRLTDRRQNVWNEAKELADIAADENRAFSGEEEGKWQTLNAELDALDKRIKSIIDGEQRAKDAEESFAKLRGTPEGNPPGKKVAGPADGDLDAAFRALGRGERRTVEVALPDYAQRRALIEQRAPLLTTSAPLPTSFVGQLYQFLVDTSSMRQANPTVYTTSSGEPLVVPRSTAEGAATWTAENVALTESNPTLSSVTLNSYKVGKIIYASTELLQDTGFDLLGFIAEHAGRNIGIAVDTAYVNGPGTTQPTGFIGTATVGRTTPAGGVTTFPPEEVFELFHSVIPQYRNRASWLMHDSTIKMVRKLRDASGASASTGNFIWQPGLQAGQPDTLLGRPVYADPNVPVIGANAKIMAFGDFGGYWIRDVSPLRFDRSDDFKFDTDVVSFRVLYRTDGKLGDTNAVKVLQLSAT